MSLHSSQICVGLRQVRAGAKKYTEFSKNLLQIVQYCWNPFSCINLGFLGIIHKRLVEFRQDFLALIRIETDSDSSKKQLRHQFQRLLLVGSAMYEKVIEMNIIRYGLALVTPKKILLSVWQSPPNRPSF